MLDGSKFFECSCGHDAHTLRFIMDEQDKLVYVTHFLESSRFFRRLWIGIKYILGFKCRYGHFSETILEQDQVCCLNEFCSKFLEFIDEQ